MPKKYHELKVVTYVQATEDENKVIQAVRNLIGDEKAGEIEISETEGVHTNTILVLVLRIKKEREISSVMDNIVKLKIWEKAMSQVDERLDEDMVFHMRVDKESAFDGEPVLWNGGESMELKLKVATYPASWERAKEILLKL